MNWFYTHSVLPPDNLRVLVAIDDPARWVQVATRDGDNWEDEDEFLIEFPVIAWMPLPMHPKDHNDKVYLAMVERYEKLNQESLADSPF